MEKGSQLLTLCIGIFFLFVVKMDVGPIFCINLVIMLVIMHYALCISHYAGFGTHSELSNFWVACDSLWVEPLVMSSIMSSKYAIS